METATITILRETAERVLTLAIEGGAVLDDGSEAFVPYRQAALDLAIELAVVPDGGLELAQHLVTNPYG